MAKKTPPSSKAKSPRGRAKTSTAPKKTKAAPKKVTRSPKKTKSIPAPEEPIKKVQAEIVPAKISRSSERVATPVQAEIVENLPSTGTAGALTPLTDGLTHYLASINKYPLLSRDQEQIIAERYFKDHNPQDAEVLVTSNLRFVVKVAAEYAKFGHRLIDLIQEGNVGLMHAVKEFNPYKGARLITYAVWWIRGYIQEYLMRQHSIVRIGTTQNQRKLFYHLKKEKELLDQMGQDSSVKMLSERLGIPEDDIKMMEVRMSGKDISLDQPIGTENDTPRLELSASDEWSVDEELEHRESLHMLEEKISELRPTLNEKELYLLDQRLLADPPLTLQEIGEQWGVTREAVRQMEARLMKKIRQQMQSFEPA